MRANALFSLPKATIVVKPHGTWNDGRKLRKAYSVYMGNELWGTYCYEAQAEAVAGRLRSEVAA